MLNTCLKCKRYSEDKEVSDDGKFIICPFCGEMQEIKRMPLFIITGASGIGKTTVSTQLFLREKEYIVLESDILWNDAFNNPENDYKEYRELWLRLCKNIAQIGMPVVLCGCSTPQQFENCIERKYFSVIHYLAIVGSDNVLVEQLRNGRNVNDEDWINSSISFNQWLKNNADKTDPQIRLLDITDITVKDAAEIIDDWIHTNLPDEQK